MRHHSDCYSTGTVTGVEPAASWAGLGHLTNSLFTGDVNGKLSTGGLVGANHALSPTATLLKCHVNGTPAGWWVWTAVRHQIQTVTPIGSVIGIKGNWVWWLKRRLITGSYFSGTVAVERHRGLVGANKAP